MRTFFFLLAGGMAWGQTAPPVVLVNGYQDLPCENRVSRETFGQLEEKLRATGREVIWFNNCSVPAAGEPRPTIEEMGAALGRRIAESGAAEVDAVVHSMGGLILRSYLAGKQNAPGTFVPPANPRVRKAVFLGSPHFGIGFAALFGTVAAVDPQVRALLPGSRFLFDLGTWNQGGDDLRGVDAVAVAGAANGTGDGLVPFTSASLRFQAGEDRLRVVPYCHTNSPLLRLAAPGCARAPYLAEVDSEDHLSWRIIRSFLDGTAEWRGLGEAPGSSWNTAGGLLLSYQDREGRAVETAARVTAGTVELAKGAFAWSADFVPAGRQDVRIAATPEVTAGVNLGPAGFNVAVVKPGPQVAAVLPAAGRVPGLSRAPGMFVSIYGSGLAAGTGQAVSLPLPTELAGVRVLVNGAATGLQFVGPGQINAILPEGARGLVRLEVRNADGAHGLNVLVEAAAPAIFTQSGTGVGAAAAIDAVTGALNTAQSAGRTGTLVAVFATGLGATEARGGLAWATTPVEVELGGVRVTPAYAGRAPGFAGLDQVNFVVPAEAPRGAAVRLRLVSGGRASNETTLAVE
jgi:uncharacterized protein (TIGR03437 family)